MTRSTSRGLSSRAKRVGIRTIRRWLHGSVAVISAQDHIDQIIHAELVGAIIQPEQIRAFIHPVVVAIVYRSRDDIAEAEEIQRLRREKAQG